MSSPVTGINPDMLRWARERAGCSIGEAARAMKKSEDEIGRWETGLGAPTYPQLEKLAYQLYKRPLAIFFFPKPPAERDPHTEFRTLPEFEIENLSRATRFAIRQANAMQLALKELNVGINPSDRKILRDVKATPRILAADLALQVREYLGFSLQEQISWRDNKDALEHWRSLIQDAGIFVFKDSFKPDDISGFCLIDPEFPVVYLNNSTAAARQSFTLFHEMAHIFFNTSGITKLDDVYISALADPARTIEVFANHFAGECLVPSRDFDKILRGSYNDQFIEEAAHRYHVSREVIVRKLLDRDLVSKQFFNSKYEQYKKEYQKRQKKKAGGDFYARHAAYLGDKYLQLAFGKYYQGHYGIEQLADYLGVKVQSVAGMEERFLRRAIA